MRKKALIFDMDGVIIDSEGIHLRALYEFLRSLKPELRLEELYQVVGRSREDVWSRIQRAVETDLPWEELHRIYKEEWTPVHPKELDYRSIYRPETGEMLARARAAGLRTAVAPSTKYEVVMEVMREVGIDSQLDLVMSGEFFARSKPDPAIYLKTCEMLSVSPADCLVIEDSTVGIRAAHDAGAEVAALIDDRYGFDRRLADHEISRISELWQYL